jgi:hypothetical protein
MSNAAGRARTSGPCVGRFELWVLHEVRPKSWLPRGARPNSVKQMTKLLQRGRRSNRQPLFYGWSNRLDGRSDQQRLFLRWPGRLISWLDRQPLFQGRSDRQRRPAAETLGEHETPTVVRAWESHRESHPVENYLNC